MEQINKGKNYILRSIRVGVFLALRQLKRSSKWTTLLIVFIMTLTFLNLVVVSGILIGLISGASEDYKKQYSGDVLIATLISKDYIQQSNETIRFIKSLPGVEDVTGRYLVSGNIEANYKTKKRQSDKTNSVGATIAGIDPVQEDTTTNISKYVIEGEYLDSDDFGKVLIGGDLLKQFFPFSSPNFPTLENVYVGSKVRIITEGITKEVEIKGIVKSKIDEIGRRIYFTDREFRSMFGRTDYNVNEIAITIDKNIDPVVIRDAIKTSGYARDGIVQTWEESQGQAFKDIINTFSMLGNSIGAIGIAVASITIFIVIFINAITRRKYIGILKGIGISGISIEISYVLQSLFYAIIGSLVGIVIVFGFLEPYFRENPIDFPFSDGILAVTYGGAFFKILILTCITMLAGYLPARMIVKKNTLDSILGR